MVKDDVDRVRRALMPLCEPLHDVFTWADQERRERLPEFVDDRLYGWLATHTVRAFAHAGLSKRDLGPWKVTGNHARNGELWLTDGMYRARILHALSDDDVPPPGPNKARSAYYRNVPLPLQMPLTGPSCDRLLILWRVYGKDSVPSFRVVRPIGNWKWGARAQTDLDFPLPETAEDLEDLRFEPADDLGLDLPYEDEREGGNDAGGLTG